ncbi:MAG: hypothetical protein U9R07_02535 [Pseudomonadota bacterium]|nr:hypothetical protein [Pseudomonadota bacterium]
MTHYHPPACCPGPDHPPLPDIASGLRQLPRETALFGGWRAAMLRAIGDHPALAGWTADSAGDLGVMLIEAWAYVLDVLSFYDARIAERTFLGTAAEAEIAAEIVGLLGYVPRPALAATVDLVLRAEGGSDPVTVPDRTRFRSEAFGTEPPQVFEVLSQQQIWPQRNQWTFAPWRRPEFTAPLRFLRGASPPAGAVLALTVNHTPRAAGRVASVTTEAASDLERYQVAAFEDPHCLDGLLGADRSAIRCFAMAMRIGVTQLVPSGTSAVTQAGSTLTLLLDTLYTQLGAGQLAVIELGGTDGTSQFYPVTISEHAPFPMSLPTAVTGVNYSLTVSKIVVSLAASVSGKTVQVHAIARLLGPVSRPAEPTRSLTDIRLDGDLVRPAPPLGTAPSGGRFMAVGAAAQGGAFDGQIVEEAEHRRFVPGGAAAEFAAPLVAPVRLLGNVVTAVRGETIAREVIGSGDVAQPWQRFKLSRKPLTWVEDSRAASRRSPQLDLYVDGMRWQWVESFYGQKPDARIFIVEMEADGTAWVCGGDGTTGSRFPSGAGNLVATYRTGAGRAKPPAGSIKQIVQAAPGLLGVESPLAPYGGADAETAAEIAVAAPNGAQMLGRAVSPADFLALARSFSGIVNAAVTVEWNSAALQPMVVIRYIADGGDPGPALAQDLELRVLPGTLVVVEAATRAAVTGFAISLDIDPAWDAALVRTAASQALFDPETGLLSARRLGIGQPLFRSTLSAVLHEIAGVRSVTSIQFNGAEMPPAIDPGRGAWFDLAAVGRIV